MKNVILLVSASLIFMVGGCDKVKDPIQHGGGVTDTVKYVRKVLLEEYTGHKCGNCPPAAVEAERLIDEGNVVVITIHAGTFAKTDAKYPTSYTTTAGNDWTGTAGFNVQAYPSGIFNRKDYGSGLTLSAVGAWAGAAALAKAEPYILGLEVKPSYSSSSRILNTTVKAKFKTSYDKEIKLSVVLTEDSIVGEQTDYTLNPDLIPNYVFMNMLRGDINGSWGATLKNPSDGPILAKDSVIQSFPNFAIDPKFNDKHLYVVAFAYNSETREVLQVERVKIR